MNQSNNTDDEYNLLRKIEEIESKLIHSIENFESKLNIFGVILLRGSALLLLAAAMAIAIGQLFPVLVVLPKH
jgi:hypothetical protein